MDDRFKDMDPELLKKANDPDAELTQIEIDALLYFKRTLSYNLIKADTPSQPGLLGCWFGGQPNLPAHIAWPTYKLISNDDSLNMPMCHVLQLNLRSFPVLQGFHSLPAKGTLNFFMDINLFQMSDVIQGGDFRPASKVIYSAEEPNFHPLRIPPELPLEEIEKFLNENEKEINGYIYEFNTKEMANIISREDISSAVVYQSSEGGFRNKQYNRASLDSELNSEENPFHILPSGGRYIDDELHFYLVRIDSYQSWFPKYIHNMAFWISEKDLNLGKFDNVFAKEYA